MDGMGRLIYGSAGLTFEFDDRTLTHIKLAIVAKLRNHESFLLNWDIPLDQGSGRVSLWVSREIPMAFTFDGSRPPALNPKWMAALLQTSARTGGMIVMAEEEAEARLQS